jgi:1,4-alpha-glucan branching enzyme
MKRGQYLLVLHAHMPYVMAHGRWPHGEVWLYEAAAEVYLPLLQVIDELVAADIPCPITLGLTPILLEQLRSHTFREGFSAYLEDRLRRARDDQGTPVLAPLARAWEHHFEALRARWDAIHGDIVGAFAALAAAGHIELLGGFATHGYAALLKHDSMIHAQLELGLRTSERHLGRRPKGIWLPECSFRPEGPWRVPALGREEHQRRGVDRILEEHGVSHFFVEAGLVMGARSEGLVEASGFRKVDWEEATRYPGRGWRSVLQPHRVGSHGGPSAVAAFARHPALSERVWSAEVGYPGDGAYLEFHKRKDGDGLRYWRVTDRKAGLGEKLLYDPALAEASRWRDADDLARRIATELAHFHTWAEPEGVVTTTFDAELFGHWWFEGPAFLRSLFQKLHQHNQVRALTAEQSLASTPPDKVAWLPEGSWGAGSDHRVWLNEQTQWMWEALYRAEDRFLGLRWSVSKARNKRARELMVVAARELLLLQASDWPFVIRTGGAVDYGFRRFCGHLDRFDNACTLAQEALDGQRTSPLASLRLREGLASDAVYAEIDLGLWQG